MYLTMCWPVDEVLCSDSDKAIEFDGVPCEWEESDLDEYLDVSILLNGVKGDRVSLEQMDGGLVCKIRFIVPHDYSAENQEQLANAIAGGLSDGFGENGLQAQGHNVYLDLNLSDDPILSSAPGPTVLPTLAVLAFGGNVDALREGINAARASNTLESALQSTLETMRPLSLAVSSGEVEKVQILLDAGADPNGDGVHTPMESAALVNTQCLPDVAAVDMVERLVAAGASIKNATELASMAKSRGKKKLSEYLSALEG